MAQDSDAMLVELRAIKLLVMLQLLRQGAKRSEIAGMLGVSERTLGRMLGKNAGKATVSVAEEEG